MGHALMENRSGLAVGGVASRATGTAEREQALVLIERHLGVSNRRITLGADIAVANVRIAAREAARARRRISIFI